MRLLVLLSLALIAVGCSHESDRGSYVGKMNLETGEFTPGPGFKPGDVAPLPPEYIVSPLPTEFLKNASETHVYLVAVTGKVEQDYDLNNDNAPSGYLLIDEVDSRSAARPGVKDCFRLSPLKGSKDDVTLARLMKDHGTATVNGWLSASGGWSKIDIISIKESLAKVTKSAPDTCLIGKYGIGEAPGVLPPGSVPQPGHIVRQPAPPFPEAFDDFVIGVKLAEYESVLPGGNRAALVVEFVRSGSLAEKAGLREGDAVTHWMISVPDNQTKTSSTYGYEFSTKTRLAAFYRTAREMEGATSFSLGFFRNGREWKEVEFPIEVLTPRCGGGRPATLQPFSEPIPPHKVTGDPKPESLPDDLPEG